MPPVKTAALEPPVNLSRVKGKLTNMLNNLTRGRVRHSGGRKMKMKKKGSSQKDNKETQGAREPSETESRSCRHLGWNAAVRRVLLP
jgi:hypothetical protein